MKLTQTPLMDWIKAEHVDFFAEFYKYLANHFHYWGVKQENGEYVWFCCLNESCQAGFILEYIHKTRPGHLSSVAVITEKCYEIIG
jgi:hypothetical protein